MIKEYYLNDCGHYVSRKSYPMTIGKGCKHLCGDIICMGGDNDWCHPAKEVPKEVCIPCLQARIDTLEVGAVYRVMLQHCTTKSRQQAELKRVDESDCTWRFPCDNSELSYDWSVIAIMCDLKEG